MNKTINECESCSKNQFPSKPVQEGEPQTEYQGKSRTTKTYFRCKECGANWLVIEDEGLGGYGKYSHKL